MYYFLEAVSYLRQCNISYEELQYAKRLYSSRIPSLVACPGFREEPAPSSCGKAAELPSAELQPVSPAVALAFSCVFQLQLLDSHLLENLKEMRVLSYALFLYKIVFVKT